MNAPLRSQLRAAIIARLSQLTRTNGMYLNAVKVVPSQIKVAEDLANIFDQDTVPPAIVVALGDKSYKAAGIQNPARRWSSDLEIAIYVMSGHARAMDAGRLATDNAARLTNRADPGIDVMLEHVEELLIGWAPGIVGCNHLRPENETEVFSDKAASIWELTFTCTIEREVAGRVACPSVEAFRKALAIDTDHILDATTEADTIVTTATELEP